MKPLTAGEFWRLSRDERRERIEHAEDTDTCSVCCKPILAGQARNGLHHSHYDCSDVGPPPTDEEIEKLTRKIDTLLARTKSRR
jgi:protein-tyrosine phosphatase